MKRKNVLAAIRDAGYHGDTDAGFLLYLENWVSLSTYEREFASGAAMRQNGVPCSCWKCHRHQNDGAPGLRAQYGR